MSEPAPVWVEPFTQCPAYYYSMGANRHCQLAAGHDGHHYAAGGQWDAVNYTTTNLFWEGLPRREEAPKPRLPVAYIAGPMTGRANWNFPAFHKAEAKLASKGYDVINPATEFGGRTDLSRETYLRRAIENVLRADVVFVLRGWQQSAGAKLEVAVAEAVGVEVKKL